MDCNLQNIIYKLLPSITFENLKKYKGGIPRTSAVDRSSTQLNRLLMISQMVTKQLQHATSIIP